MSSKEKLSQMLEHLMNNNPTKASELVGSYIIETAAEIHQTIVENEEEIEEMEREVPHNDMGDDLANEISANKDEIHSEEMMGEEEGEEGHEGDELAGADELEVVGDEAGAEGSEGEMGLEDLHSQVTDMHDEVSGLEDKFAELEAAFDAIKNTEEEEHGEDFDKDGVIGEPEAGGEAGAEGEGEIDLGGEHEEEAPVGEAKEEDEDENKDQLEEAMELHPVKADNKDKSDKAASPIVPNKGNILKLGGKPVKTIDKGHKGFERENPSKKPGQVTKDTNHVKTGKEALVAAKKPELKDKAPKAGASPAMPKNHN